MTGLLLLLSFVPGCSRDDADVWETGSGNSELRIRLADFSGDENAYAHELNIHNLYVFIYDSEHDMLLNAGHTHVAPGPDGSLVDDAGYIRDSWRVWAGSEARSVYVLANVPSELYLIEPEGSEPKPAEELLDHPSMNDLVLLTQRPELFCEDYLTGQSDDWRGGLMCGVSTDTRLAAGPNVARISLKRCYARLDLRLRTVPELEGHDVRVTAMHLRAPGQPLFYFDQLPLDIWAGTQFYKTDSRPMSHPVGTSFGECLFAPAGSDGEESRIYLSMFNAEKGWNYPETAEEGYTVCLDVTIDGREVDPYYIGLVRTDEEGVQHYEEAYSIEPGKIYKVDATLSRRSIDAAIDIEEWHDRSLPAPLATSEIEVGDNRKIWLFAGGLELEEVVLHAKADKLSLQLSEQARKANYRLEGADKSGILTVSPDKDGRFRFRMASPYFDVTDPENLYEKPYFFQLHERSAAR